MKKYPSGKQFILIGILILYALAAVVFILTNRQDKKSAGILQEITKNKNQTEDRNMVIKEEEEIYEVPLEGDDAGNETEILGGDSGYQMPQSNPAQETHSSEPSSSSGGSSTQEESGSSNQEGDAAKNALPILGF